MGRERKAGRVGRGGRGIVYLVILALIGALNLVSWCSRPFCDGYIRYVFPLWVNLYGRLTGLFPFSVGEWLLYLWVICMGLALIAAPVLLVGGLLRRRRAGDGQNRGCAGNREAGESSGETGQREAGGRAGAVPESGLKAGGKTGRRPGVLGLCRLYCRFFAWAFLAVCAVMTLNCFVLYHATPFSETYFGEADIQYDLDELIRVRNYVVERCNALAREMERDGEGTVLYPGDMKAAAIEAMQSLGQTYDRLDGYYPRPKPLAASDFFSQQYMQGYYFPFSMEANYNDVMYIMNKPATMCHELAHLRGYIYEDEANFISFLACTRSSDPVFVYSGYLSVLNYLDNDFYRAVGQDRDAYWAQARISPQVIADNVFVTEEEWERIEGKALISTEVVEKASDAFTDTTLKVNGVSDGIVSYSRVVELLLQYYRESGEL